MTSGPRPPRGDPNRSLFEHLGAAAIVPRTIRFPAGALLIVQGQPAIFLFLILAGRVQVQRTHKHLVTPISVIELGPGEVAGEEDLLRGAASFFTFTALTDTVAVELPVECFRAPIAPSSLQDGVSQRLGSLLRASDLPLLFQPGYS